MADAALEPIRDALEAAFALAQRDSTRPGAPPVPRALAPVLRFNHLPDRALVTVRRAVDSDDEFRERVLAELEGQELGASLDEGAHLFLARPEGWREALDILVEEAVADADRAEDRRREEDAVHRVEQLEASKADLQLERDRLAGEVGALSSDIDALRRDSSRHRAEAESAAGRVEEVGRGRTEAVRQLKDSEALAAQRLDRVRELEAELDELRSGLDSDAGDPVGPGGASVDPGGVSAEPAPSVGEDGAGSTVRSLAAGAAPAVAAAAAAAADLATALEEVATSLVGEPRVPVAVQGDPEPEPDSRRPVAGRRRRPIRLGRGLSADSTEGLAELLARADTIVLVDGYNVSMQGWPDQVPADQRRSLLSMLGAMGAGAAAKIHVVFDGAYDGARPSVGAPLPVRVHFTESGVEADDRLLEFVEDAPLETAVVVVSSDHRVRDGARARGANAVSSETLLARGRGR